MITKLFLVSVAVSLCLRPAVARAQQLFPALLAPDFRASSNPASEYTAWNIFSNPYDAPNYGDVAASASNPSLTQTLDPNAFITSGFNIYSFSAATGYTVANAANGATPLTNVVFQFDTLGTLIDYDSIRLNYNGSASAAPIDFISENRAINSGFGGLTNRVAAQWDLTGLNVTNFTITFRALGSSNSFNLAALDTFTGAFAEAVPSARQWDGGAGDGKWESAANWSGDKITSAGGNVTFGSGSGAGVMLETTREVAELRLTQAGGFQIGASGGAMLKINTGITADAPNSGTYVVSAPVFLGGHGLMDVAAGNTVTLSGAVGGAGALDAYPAAGILKSGAGTLALLGDNTFLGSLTVEGGKLIVSGVNQYTGGTNVTQGEMIVRNNAPNGAPGALGNASSNVALGADPSTVGTLAEAALVIEGDFNVGRNVNVSAGANLKALAARGATGAVFSGNVALAASAGNISLRAEAARDVLRFTGQITGGSAANPIAKTGAGTVVFSGADKTYANATNITSGLLRIDVGTALSGSGAVTVAGGAGLIVNGTLGGGGSSLAINSGATLGGSGTVSRAFTLGSGATLLPGSGGVGTIHTVAQTWAGGGVLQVEFNRAAEGGHDLVDLAGALNLTATDASPFVLRLQTLAPGGQSGPLADFDHSAAYSWVLVSTSSGITGFAGAAQFAVDASGFGNYVPGSGSFSVSQAGGALLLQFTPAPEPSAWAMVAALAAGLGFCARRRRYAA